MPTASPIGTLKISVDGSWDIDDLRAVSESLAESYALFYPLYVSDHEVSSRLRNILSRHFWSGEIETKDFGLFLYRSIPDEENLKLKSFAYASPGMMEISGVLAVLIMLSKVAESWIKTGDRFLALWERVDKFYKKRRHLRRPSKKILLDDEIALTLEEARTLVFDLGSGLGFDTLSCEHLIDIVGSPLSALRYLVTVGRDGRKLSNLQGEGKLHLPPVSNAAIEVRNPDRSRHKADNAAVRRGMRPRPKKG